MKMFWSNHITYYAINIFYTKKSSANYTAALNSSNANCYCGIVKMRKLKDEDIKTVSDDLLVHPKLWMCARVTATFLSDNSKAVSL